MVDAWEKAISDIRGPEHSTLECNAMDSICMEYHIDACNIIICKNILTLDRS
jgi:hypothetical protein